MTKAVSQGPAEVTESRGSYAVMLVVLLSATFIVQFDFFVVNVAAPSLGTDLQASAAALELIVGGYAFAYASGMITGGRLGDLHGHRKLFVIGVIAFTVTSLLCGITVTAEQLVLARLAQGLAGALMVPQVLAVITSDFPAEARGRAFAGYGIALGLGSIAGQVLGGAMVQADVAGLGWRLIFLINVPIGIVTAIVAARVLPDKRDNPQTGLDPLGALGLSAALALLLVPLGMGHSAGWPAWTWICMALAVPVAAATLRWEQLLGRRGKSPMLDLALFRVSSFRAGLIAGVAFNLYFGSLMFTLTLLLQSGLNLSPFMAGVVFSPMGVFFSLSAMYGGKLTARFGMNSLVWGSLVTAVGLVLLAVGLNVSGADIGLGWLLFCLALVGLGNGAVLPSLMGASLIKVEPQAAGVASGVLTTSQQFAISGGVAVIGALYFSLIGDRTGGAAHASAMQWALWINLVLVFAVIGMVLVLKRIEKETRAS
ncbi:EmrB/QacA subfamily drug resistance transporter [Saccharothrix ecbatanensis]|uniref:EmrB/QacA subfamily drug resistance transporter n=1 Tax=Saccharothrix ecbatanensis TaxID=1105145 RepID=A0A7W9HKT4_9PSEU|nr:MFS transporter [Saccharothrix ecbatanensis]MBB5803796.1 EmrB/QacA subfamily drug resistance transporter [Saccharothrix ecbatanensis]